MAVQETEVWRPEDSDVRLYTHVEKEVLTGSIPGSVFTTSGSQISAIFRTDIETNGSPLAQYAASTGSIARRDCLIYMQKSGKDTEWNTASVSASITTTGSVTFSDNIAAGTADNVVMSYSHTLQDKSNEVTEVSESGGGRPVEYITVYGGKKIAIKRVQDPFHVDITVLKSNLDFAAMINGETVLEIRDSIGSVTTSRGGDKRLPRTMVIEDTDPENDNQLFFVYYNVLGVSKEVGGPADAHFTETVGFDCKPEDKVEIHILDTN